MSYIIDKNTALSAKIGDSPFLAVKSSVIGRSFIDPGDKGRRWIVCDLFLTEETWGEEEGPWKGILFRCIDDKGSMGCIDQEELEVALHMAQPGTSIPWAYGERYTNPLNAQGIYCDKWVSAADLYLRECRIRVTLHNRGQGVVISPGTTINRTVKESDGREFREVWACQEDATLSGLGPDTKFQSIFRRWSKVNLQAI